MDSTHGTGLLQIVKRQQLRLLMSWEWSEHTAESNHAS